jgi:transcription antitermination factor NusG
VNIAISSCTAAGSAYVVVTRANSEQFVAEELAGAGFTAYAPTQARLVRGAGRPRRVVGGLLSRYLFVWSDDIERDFDAIRHTRRVVGILGLDGKPVRVPTLWLTGVMMAQTFGCFDYTRARRPAMSLGQRVRLIAGQFKGYTGVVAQLYKRDETRVRVAFQGKAMRGTMAIETDKLEPILTDHKNQ